MERRAERGTVKKAEPSITFSVLRPQPSHFSALACHRDKIPGAWLSWGLNEMRRIIGICYHSINGSWLLICHTVPLIHWQTEAHEEKMALPTVTQRTELELGRARLSATSSSLSCVAHRLCPFIVAFFPLWPSSPRKCAQS